MKIKKGDFITVQNWINVNDNSYKRDCLEVKVIDYPLIRVLRHTGYAHSTDLLTLSLKEVNVKKLSKAFILSCVPDYKGRLPNDTEANNFDDRVLITWVATWVCTIFYIL